MDDLLAGVPGPPTISRTRPTRSPLTPRPKSEGPAFTRAVRQPPGVQIQLIPLRFLQGDTSPSGSPALSATTHRTRGGLYRIAAEPYSGVDGRYSQIH